MKEKNLIQADFETLAESNQLSIRINKQAAKPPTTIIALCVTSHILLGSSNYLT
jgi:hypothetical protein